MTRKLILKNTSLLDNIFIFYLFIHFFFMGRIIFFCRNPNKNKFESVYLSWHIYALTTYFYDFNINFIITFNYNI